MIHCVCNNINTAKVDAAAHAGACRPKEVLAHHGKAFNCGQCKGSIAERLACHAGSALMAEVSRLPVIRPCPDRGMIAAQ